MTKYSFTLLLLILIFEAKQIVASIHVTFEPSRVEKLKQESQIVVSYTLTDPNVTGRFKILSSDAEIVNIYDGEDFVIEDENKIPFNSSFSLRANFMGHANIYVEENKGNVSQVQKSNVLRVSVIREQPLISKVFTISVVILVSLNYINMGAVVNLNSVKEVLKKPFAPMIGLFSQYLIMPLVSYVAALYLMDEPYQQMGLFTFGCSPGGGASNIYTLLLNGDLNLSLTMTFISTLASLGMMPLWILTLGQKFFGSLSTKVPYTTIIGTVLSMVVPLSIGLCFQRWAPRVAAFCRRILGPVCLILVLYIIAFGTYANLFMFRIITWKMFAAGCINVWVGFLGGAILARLANMSKKAIITIAIETGLQNTGIAIVLLLVSLPEPDGDLASVVPVAASLSTPIPLAPVYFYQLYHRCKNKSVDEENSCKETITGNHQEEPHIPMMSVKSEVAAV